MKQNLVSGESLILYKGSDTVYGLLML